MFSLDFFFFNGSITHTTGRLALTTVQGNCLLKVMGQKTCHQSQRLCDTRRTRAHIHTYTQVCTILMMLVVGVGGWGG